MRKIKMIFFYAQHPLQTRSCNCRYRVISSAYYRNSVGAVLVYDITKQESFQHLEKWMKEITDFATLNCRTILVGNKIDLAHLRGVSETDAASFAESHQIDHIETSALKTTNVEKVFHNLAEQIYDTVRKTDDPSRPHITELASVRDAKSSSPSKSSGCKC